MIPERLSLLRREMEQRRIDVYIVPTADFHESEYVGEILSPVRPLCRCRRARGGSLCALKRRFFS